MSAPTVQVDFYHLTRDPAEKLIPVLAQKTLDGGQRLLLVSSDLKQIDIISSSLWGAGKSSFLAHGLAGCEDENIQPILISDECQAANGAKFIALADGVWRDQALSFERAFFLFAENNIEGARDAWRALSANENVKSHYWKQEDGRWKEGP